MASIHTTVDVEPEHVHVKPIDGHPGHYVLHFAEYSMANLHFTPAEWDRIDATVRAQMGAEALKAVS